MAENIVITFGPKKVFKLPKDYVAVVMKRKSFDRVIGEISRVQDELAKSRAVVIRKVLKGSKVIYVEDKHAGSEGRRVRDQKRGKKK